MYRTFIKLGEFELDFIRKMQQANQERFRLKSRPPMSKVIRQIILDYRELIESYQRKVSMGVTTGPLELTKD
jgi:hypothetical protein